MSYDTDALLDLLFQEFDFDRSKAFEFGWCNILEAEDRSYKRTVYIYYPRGEVWADSAAKKSLIKQFKDYDQLTTHECLPEAIELLEGKKAAGAIALITARSTDPNLTMGEREGEALGWEGSDSFEFPDKIGATLRFAEAVRILHDFGMVHAALGHHTVSVRKSGTDPVVRVDLLNFSEQNEKLPAPSLFFEPAFAAPELLNPENGGMPVQTQKSDVYAAGKFLIYMLTGPQGFLSFFNESEVDEESSQGTVGQLYDHVLWTNIAQRMPDLEARALVDASGGKMSSELAELLVRAVAYDPDRRLESGTMLAHGLSSVLGGAVVRPEPMEETGRRRRSSDSDSGVNIPMIAGIAAVVLIVLGGGWYFMTQRAEQAALDQLMADTRDACVRFTNRTDTLASSTITQRDEWAAIASIIQRVQANGEAVETLGDSLELCTNGNTSLNQLQGTFLTDLREGAESEAEFAAANGVDVSALNVEDRLAQADERISERDFEGSENALVPLLAEIVAAHDVTRQAELEAAVAAAEAAQARIDADPEQTEDLTAAIAAAALLAEDPPSAKLLRTKLDAENNIDEATGDLVGTVATQRLADLTALTQEVDATGASFAQLGFDALAGQSAALAEAGVPESTEEALGVLDSADNIADQLVQIRDYAATLAAEMGDLNRQIAFREQVAADNGWSNEGAMPDLLDAALNYAPQSVFQDWQTLNALDSDLEDELNRLSAVWDEGRAACTGLRQELAQIDPLDSTTIWPELSAILNNSAEYEGPDATEDMFAGCARGQTLVELGTIELGTQDLLAEMERSMSELQSRGAGPFLPAFAEAEQMMAPLVSAPVPQDRDSYVAFSENAFDVLDRLDLASADFGRAEAENASLMTDLNTLLGQIGDLPLVGLPEYQTVVEGLPAVEGHVLQRNVALRTNIDDLTDILRRFENGELINCNIGDLAFLPVVLTAEQIEASLSGLRTAAEASDIALPPDLASMQSYCLSATPVTMEQLDAYAATLRPRDQDVRGEVAVVRATESGHASNVSFWLAQRYLEHISAGVEEPVCIASGFAVAAAQNAGVEAFVASNGGEIVDQSCGGGGVVSRTLAIGPDGTSASCVAVNSRQARLSFRLAAGDICR